MELIVFLGIVLSINGFDPVKFSLTTVGNKFAATNAVELLSTFPNVRTRIRCAMLCYRNNLCRTFDFDSSSKECRSFEGSVDTGSLLANFPSTVVGWINMKPQAFDLYNASNDQCVDNRFLDSETSSGRCECPIHTFWNGSICLNQRFANDTCTHDNWCRMDLWMNCTSMKCVATNVPSCPPQTVSSGILYNVTNPTSTTYPVYVCHAYTWIATGSSATLSFFFRHDPNAWLLDDVSVYHGSTQLIKNGGFETGNLAGWNHSGSCLYNRGTTKQDKYNAKSGYYYYYDRCYLYGDTLSQTFPTITGRSYIISFWLMSNQCCSTAIIANITVV